MSLPWPPDPEKIFWLDYETFCEISLPEYGVINYARHPSNRIIMASYAVGSGPVQLWDSYFNTVADAEEWIQYLRDPSYYIGAFHANFERVITREVLGIDLPPERFLCLQVLSYVASFARGLEDVCAQMELDEGESKLKGGKSLMLKFTQPRTPSQSDSSTVWSPHNAYSDWMEFRRYCFFDTESQRALYTRVLRDEIDAFDEVERWIYCEHSRIQERGVPLDVNLARWGQAVREWYEGQLIDELKQLTGLENPRSRNQLLEWLNTRDSMNFYIPDLQKATVQEYLEHPNTAALPEVERALQIRAATTKTSLDKFAAIERLKSEGPESGIITYTLQFRGATRTGRDAGRGLQVQNLPRGFLKDPDEDGDLLSEGKWQELQAKYPDVPLEELLTWCIRPAISAPEGRRFVGADLSSIETAVVAWLSSCSVLLEALAQGVCPYRLFATWAFGVPYNEVTKEQRTFSKPPVLGGVYRMGPPALVDYAKGMGVGMELNEAERLTQILRTRYSEIKRMWWWFDDALPWLVQQPIGTELEGYRCRFVRTEKFLRIYLPSGRPILYYDPIVREDKRFDKWQWGYMGWNSRAHKWTRVWSHGGIVTEQITQSTARDLLYRVALPRMISTGLDPRFLVHDEAVTLAWEEESEEHLRLLLDSLTASPGWPGDETLYLRAEGSIFRRHRKD